MRIVRVTAVVLAAALGAAAVAAAVDRRPEQRREDEAEQVRSVSGTLAHDGEVFTLAGNALGLGARWWRETARVADADGDGTIEAVVTELAGFVGKSVTATGEDEGDELSVRTLNGTTLRAAGRPPWAGRPNREAKCKRRAAAKAKGAGPPPWAKAHGRRGC